jgi:hypothetical protein
LRQSPELVDRTLGDNVKRGGRGDPTMNDRVCEGRPVLVLALAAVMILTGCATIRRSEARSTEEMLAAAGFVMRPADTAERQQRLAARPPYRLESHAKDGRVVYTYADPDGCKCLYVGGPKEYSEYQHLRLQRQIAADEAWGGHAADMEWNVWGLGR